MLMFVLLLIKIDLDEPIRKKSNHAILNRNRTEPTPNRPSPNQGPYLLNFVGVNINVLFIRSKISIVMLKRSALLHSHVSAREFEFIFRHICTIKYVSSHTKNVCNIRNDLQLHLCLRTLVNMVPVAQGSKLKDVKYGTRNVRSFNKGSTCFMTRVKPSDNSETGQVTCFKIFSAATSPL
jgi:hypothetical protein